MEIAAPAQYEVLCILEIGDRQNNHRILKPPSAELFRPSPSLGFILYV